MRTTCKVCGKRKVIPAQMQKGVSRTEFAEDPYCSRTCCEADHGLRVAADLGPHHKQKVTA